MKRVHISLMTLFAVLAHAQLPDPFINNCYPNCSTMPQPSSGFNVSEGTAAGAFTVGGTLSAKGALSVNGTFSASTNTIVTVQTCPNGSCSAQLIKDAINRLPPVSTGNPFHGGIVVIPPGEYQLQSTDTPIVIPQSLVLKGSGNSTVIKSFLTSSPAISIETDDPVSISDLTLYNGYPASSAGTGAGIAVNGRYGTRCSPNGDPLVQCTLNSQSKLYNIQVNGFFIGIDIRDAAVWTVSNCVIQGSTGYGIYVHGTTLWDAGDSSISGCFITGYGTNTYLSGIVTAGVRQESHGGIRFYGNKVMAAQVGYDLQMAPGAGTGNLAITGNSMEGFSSTSPGPLAIRLGMMDPNSGGGFTDVMLSGNEFGASGVLADFGVRKIAITGNSFDRVALSGLTPLVVKTANVSVTGNTFSSNTYAGTDAPGIKVLNGADEVSLVGNYFNNYYTKIQNLASNSANVTSLNAGPLGYDLFGGLTNGGDYGFDTSLRINGHVNSLAPGVIQSGEPVGYGNSFILGNNYFGNSGGTVSRINPSLGGSYLAMTAPGSGAGIFRFRQFTPSAALPGGIYTAAVIDASGNLGIGLENPSERLQVSGNVKAGGYAAVTGGYGQSGTGGEVLRTVRGEIDGGSGGMTQGGGFTSVRRSAGWYTVTFSTAFSAKPAVTATTVTSIASFAVVTAKDNGSFDVKTFAQNGTIGDITFDFVAVGQP